ncbi:hypothetical protein AAGU66_06185 [Edwardsiella ictaluri]|uniref:hypothetical protein n=1 Tax=Edwardsiella ictaluri TaxID=67780 RepID=UPI001E31BD84|nr:hypothetical protein [Edwardsiella ictaluri]UYB62868.1 hypothetical protein N8I66_06805 [Edwardsiella ictaluri]UYB66094.1 hypothetical protein N8I67_06800 [Edwardsiella ictaluri]
MLTTHQRIRPIPPGKAYSPATTGEPHNPTHILFGGGRIADIPQSIPVGARILLTYGGNNAHQCGYLDGVRRVLGPRIVAEFGGIEAPCGRRC